jgi:hypothetical protein
LVEPLLPELDFDELLFELAVVFFDPLELPDLVGIRFLPSGAVEPPSGSKVSDRHPRVLRALVVPLLFFRNKSDTNDSTGGARPSMIDA